VTEYERCPRCSRTNPPENRFCGGCGASLESSGELVPRREGSLTIAGCSLPEKLGPFGKALAVGLATLAAEVGLHWLRHKTRSEERPSTLTKRELYTVVPERFLGQSREHILIQKLDGDNRSWIFAWRVIRTIVISERPEKRS